MKLQTALVNDWPKLAWVARLSAGCRDITVLHGPGVESGPDFCVEAVWPGPFDAAGFDHSDLVFGSGIRVRPEGVTFVTSSTALDRLWYCGGPEVWHVSNTLPGLLAVAWMGLREDYGDYRADMLSIEHKGLYSYVRRVPADGGELSVLYFQNLFFDGWKLVEVDKPDLSPHFGCFGEYQDFLVATARSLGANCASPARRQAVTPLVGISSGYDSPAVAVIARHAGCTQAVTIVNSCSLWRGSDSGEVVARRLGMSCRAYRHEAAHYRHEECIWAACGGPGGLNLTLFDYPQPLCLFFNGSYGDKVWDRRFHDLSCPVGDTDSMLAEFRLFQGVFHTVVPWWGIRRAQEINALGGRPEMAPWTLHSRYDRPVARRVIEEAGVPRGSFARRKKNTSANTEILWPRTAAGRESFGRYLARRGIAAAGGGRVRLVSCLAHLDNLIATNLTRKLHLDLNLRGRLRLEGSKLLFQWANAELKSHYRQGLAAVGRTAGQAAVGEAK